jgi:HEPN domain-containing protein
MDFTADHYYRAALERLSQAHHLYREGRGNYALAMYAAGLAVESMLRAFLLKRGKRAFESRHNLLLLAKESGMLSVNRDNLKKKGLTDEQIEEHERALWTFINDIFILWHNNYRFASEARLLAHLKKMKLYEGLKGDPLKANALRLLSASQRFIDRGVLQWQ